MKKDTSIVILSLVLIFSGYLSSSSSFFQTSKNKRNYPNSNNLYSVNTNSKSSWSDPTMISSKSVNISKNNDLTIDNSNNVHTFKLDDENYVSSGIDYNKLYRKLADLPEAPILSPISPNPSTSAKVNLIWNDADGAIDYYVFRSNSLIISTSGMIPLTRLSTSSFQDTVNTSGIYYYVIVATNLEGNSSLSNCENVSITITTLPIPQEMLNIILTGVIGVLFLGLLVLFQRKN